MAEKEIAVKKYVVRLSSEERQQLETLIREGKGPARRLLKARILLKAGCLGSWPRLERRQDHPAHGFEYSRASTSAGRCRGAAEDSAVGSGGIRTTAVNFVGCVEAWPY
jgi:hypothetical protein